jgi:hypothetical protein
MEPLFFYKKASPVMAAATSMPDDSNQWPSLVLDELFKQSPFLNVFSPMIQLDKIDSKKGFGFGMVKIESNGNSISIPIIIRDGKLSPMDIFFDGQGNGAPVSEEKINEVLLNPQVFGGSINAESATNKHIGNMLTPPWENLGGFQNMDQNTSFYEKTSMLRALDGTAAKEDIAKLASWATSIEGKVYLDSAPAEKFFTATMLKVASPVHTRRTKKAHIVQFTKSAGRYFVKVAEPENFAPPPETEVTQQQVQEALPPQDMAQLEQQGEVTVAEPAGSMPPVPQVVTEPQFAPAVNFGVYRVQSSTGEDNVGWIFPQVYSYMMEPLNQKLFADGRRYCMQQEIVGVAVGQGNALPKNPISGAGFFYLTKGSTTLAFAPVLVKGTSVDPSGNTVYMCQGMVSGNPLNISLVPGMAVPAEYGQDSYAIPPECGFMSLGEPTNPLLSDPAQATQNNSTMEQKVASGLVVTARVTRDGSVSLSGPALNGVKADFLKVADAKFLLACMRVRPSDVETKLASANNSRGLVRFIVGSPIIPREFNKIAKRTHHIDKFIGTIKCAMYKEAAELASYDPASADAILSLSFLTPDNLQKFIGFLPKLQDAMNALANLLLASRLGLAQIPEDSCANALKALDKAVNGLKLIQLRESEV